MNADSDNLNIRQFSENTIDQEIRWCIYLGISTIMVTLPSEDAYANLARIIYAKLKLNHSSPTVIEYSIGV